MQYQCQAKWHVLSHAKNILEELRGDNKERVMFYVDKNLQTKFKKICGDKKIRMSSVVEKIIQNFLDEVKGEK